MCCPMTRLGYRIRLSGPTGAVEAFLTYINPTAQEQVAYFLYPLDNNSTPIKVRVKHGDFQLETQVAPNPQDQPDDQIRDNLPISLARLFQLETERVLAIPLGTVAAGSEITFQILSACFVPECGEEGKGFSFRLPFMTSRALTTLEPDDISNYSLASGLERGAQVAVSILMEVSDLQPGKISSSHPCAMATQSNGDLAIELDRSKQLESRDFVLDYQLWSGPKPKAWLRGHGRHFLLNFLPPSLETPSLPRRLVFLVDGSEEMNNVGKARCYDCIAQVLQGLDSKDSFALVTFNRDVAGFKSGDFVETSKVAEALSWFKEYTFGGVADLKKLLERVVKLPRQPDSVLSIVLVTAGRLGNEPELYRLIQGSRESLRVFPVLLGRKADTHFARAASKATGGRAFRSLNDESVSRVAERLLEETRQPVLDVVGIQDRGLGFQGDSLTPKYPSGLSGFRPINILGLHTGPGGVEAGGKSSQGVSWSEQVELKEISHKVLPVVWAQVKACELDDEARMLDRAERSILRNVVRTLSEDYGLSNSHTAVVVHTNAGTEPRFAPHFEPWRWLKILEKADENLRPASELLEEQKAQKGIKGGRNVTAVSGRGLKMKDTLGGKKATTIFGSKLGHQNRLSGNLKENFISKPMLGATRSTSQNGHGGGIDNHMPQRGAVEASPSISQPPSIVEPLDVAQPPSISPAPSIAEPPSISPPPSIAEPPNISPPPSIAEPPSISPPPSISRPPSANTPPASIEMESVSASERPIRPVPLRTSSTPGFVKPGPPPVTPTPRPPAPEGEVPVAQTQPKLPTPRELASQVSAQARTGQPEVRAKEALSADPQGRQQLMNQMRALHGALGSTNDVTQLTALTDVVLWQLAKIATESELLVRAYGLGYQGREMLSENLEEAKQKLKFWLTRFAKLF